MDRDSYEHGVPSWVDHSSDDAAGATEFYAGLFGWQVQDLGPDAGGYCIASLRDRSVAGIGPAMTPGPPHWNSYVDVDDADAIVAKVTEAGGAVFAPPFDVMEAGRMGVFADPQGAVFSVWQPGQHTGAQVVNEPNSYSWNELVTTDVEGAKTFYGAVFGWGAVTHGEGVGAYTEWMLGDSSIGGMMAKPPQMPASVPPHWAVYFSVEDIAAAADKVKELGGSIMMGPMEIEPGTFAAALDPQGAPFNIIQLKPAG
jgi:predicted enzyme related to lactoylglutathione lyase